MNSQQPQGEYYNGYAGPMSHSPNPTRPGYATTAGIPSALNGGRRSQQSGETGGQQASALFSDDRFASFEPGQRFDRNTSAQANLQPAAAYNMFGGATQGAWNYNGGAAATMSGPMNDGSRIRANSRRPALHPVSSSPALPSIRTSLFSSSFSPSSFASHPLLIP